MWLIVIHYQTLNDRNDAFGVEKSTINTMAPLQGVPKKMFLSEMLQGRIFLNTPSFSMDKMRRI